MYAFASRGRPSAGISDSVWCGIVPEAAIGAVATTWV